MQRLDFGTSGIITAAKTPEAGAQFRAGENNGLISKYYLTLLSGELKDPVICDARLDVAKRKKVKIIPGSAPPPFRSFYYPIRFYPRDSPFFPDFEAPFTLAVCKIRRGQRHQIRAHAAALGHPLLNDSLYGAGNAKNFLLVAFFLEYFGKSRFFIAPDTPAEKAFRDNGNAILKILPRDL